MNPLIALSYSFLFGLLHGILPDEHTWPITFSYAIGGASGREGLKAGLYFSSAFSFQRMLLSELAYLALAPYLRSPGINGIVYIVVGAAMSIAGEIVLRSNHYPHIHLIGHHHNPANGMERNTVVLGRKHETPVGGAAAPDVRWTLIHGFIAGFGIGGFSIFINTVAAPAMPDAWLGFLPGLLYGLGTMVMLVLVGSLIGNSLRWTHSLTQAEIKEIGSNTGGRTLLFGGGFFVLAGILTLLGIGRYLPVEQGYIFIGLFMILIAIPAFVYSWREVKAARNGSSEFGGIS